MLRISPKDGKATRLLVLEGKLISPWTNELMETASRGRPAGNELVIDLRGVTDISEEGEEVLYALQVQGARFRGGGVFIKQVLKQLVHRVRNNDSP